MAEGITQDICVKCEAFKGMEATVQDAYISVFPVVANGLVGILIGLASIRLLMLIFQLIKGGDGQILGGQFVTELIVFIIVSGMLQGNGGMFWPAYEFIVGIGPWVGVRLIEAGGGDTGGYTGFSGLIYVADNSVLGTVFDALRGQADDISLFATLAHVAGIGILFLVYLSLTWNLTKTFLIGFFEATAVAVMAPFIIVFIAFQQTRPLTFGAFRVLMASSAKMILGAMTIVVVLSLMGKITALFQDTIELEGVNSIWGTQFMVALFTGLMMTLATSIFEDVANRIFMTFSRHFSENVGNLGSLTRLMIGR